jgi:hypothetical protein
LEEKMVNKTVILLLAVLSITISCKTNKPKPKPVKDPVKTYPAISWKRALNSKVFIVGQSRKRIFGVEFDNKNKPISVTAFDKSSGRKGWSMEVELGLTNKYNPYSFDVKVKAVAVAYWTNSNKINSVDKYRGVKLWKNSVDGLGLSVLGENFITVWKNNIRLIDPETGKITDFDMGRTITKPVHVTPKGYLVIVTGDTANLIDIENDKIAIRWKWEIDMDKGFEPGEIYSTDDAVMFFQKTHDEENQLWLKSFNGLTMKTDWELKHKGIESKAKSFGRFAKSQKARFVLIPESTDEKQWRYIDFKTGKPCGKTVYSKNDPPKKCILNEKISYCFNEKGVHAYDTKTWKELWFRETILPINDNEHKIIDGNIVLAAVNRIKIFTPDGHSPLALDLKSPNIKEPRVNRILGGVNGIIYFTVADLTPGQTKGEVWALNTKTKQIKWRVRVGRAKTIFDSVLFLPENQVILAANHFKITTIAMKSGESYPRYHKIKTNNKANVKIGFKGKIGWIVLPSAIQFFKLGKTRVILKSKFNLEKKIAAKTAKEKPVIVKYNYVGVEQNLLLLKSSNGSNEITAFDIEESKVVWKTVFKSLLEPVSLSTEGAVILTSYGSTRMVNPKDGKTIKDLKDTRRAFISGKNLIVLSQFLSKPKYGSRIYLFKYEDTKGLAPKLAWKKDFALEKEKPLMGFPKKSPLWVSAGTEYVFFPSKGGRCLNIISSADGEKILELCKGVWPWSPLFYDGKFYHTTGVLQEGIPKKQQGLIKFTLGGRFSQLLKMGKYGNPKYFNTQLMKIKKGNLYIQGNGETLQSVKVAD